nr:MAG TPA: hypothetical protein [Caudoviricetes sp.]
MIHVICQYFYDIIYVIIITNFVLLFCAMCMIYVSLYKIYSFTY